MDISSASLVFFSPTETTTKIVQGIALGIRPDIVNNIDLTPSLSEKQDSREIKDELAIIGTPVYGGRIPPEAAYRLRQIRGNNTPVVIVVVYGNREFEDALLELRDTVTDRGFVPIAGGAFIGEHSFDSENAPIASGRPDAQDLEKAKRFGESIRERMGKVHTLVNLAPLDVPGNTPYRKWDPPAEMAPITVTSLCTSCGECAAVCPTAAINVENIVMTDKKECILCSACIKKCPTLARKWDNPWIDQVTKWLITNCRERKEPQIYL